MRASISDLCLPYCALRSINCMAKLSRIHWLRGGSPSPLLCKFVILNLVTRTLPLDAVLDLLDRSGLLISPVFQNSKNGHNSLRLRFRRSYSFCLTYQRLTRGRT